MIKKRIGKDLTFRWSILTNGDAKPLDGRDFRLELKTPRRDVRVLDFSIDGIKIIFRITPDIQEATGVYSLTLWENYGKDGQTVVDICKAFQLVDCTSKESACGCGDSNIDVDCVELSVGDIEVGMTQQQGTPIEVDDALSTTSTNPVQNKVITAKINEVDADVDEISEKVDDLKENVQEADSTFTWTYVE